MALSQHYYTRKKDASSSDHGSTIVVRLDDPPKCTMAVRSE